jgi:heme/copper-type cytochrome/quinol oxidase subunit 2
MPSHPDSTAEERRLLTIIPTVMFIVVAIATLTILLGTAAMRSFSPIGRVASAAASTTTHLTVDILPVKPGGPAKNWPAYMPTSSTTLPANTVVSVTIRNFDIGDDALPAGSPLLNVQGTTGGNASADGKAYTSLDANHISHTFTIPKLHLNVPIPGDPVGDANSVTVTFSFRTPAKAGTYTFQCFIPCGTGDNGFDGPMSTAGFMRGQITISA